MASAQLGTYRARQVVYLPGDRASGVHFVGNGRVKISKVTRDGKELTLAYRSTGDFFGETCLLDGRPARGDGRGDGAVHDRRGAAGPSWTSC